MVQHGLHGQRCTSVRELAVVMHASASRVVIARTLPGPPCSDRAFIVCTQCCPKHSKWLHIASPMMVIILREGKRAEQP